MDGFVMLLSSQTVANSMGLSSEGRVAARGVVETVDVLVDGQGRRGPALESSVIHLALESGEELSSLSQQSPFRLMLHSMPLISRAFR
jgi:hypothetical protein